MEATELLLIILYLVLIILIVTSIVAIIKIIKTINKVNTAVDDVMWKANKLNGLFNIIDTTTDAISSFSDKIINGLSNMIIKFIKGKGDKNE